MRAKTNSIAHVEAIGTADEKALLDHNRYLGLYEPLPIPLLDHERSSVNGPRGRKSGNIYQFLWGEVPHRSNEA